jgi:hypothetical protein
MYGTYTPQFFEGAYRYDLYKPHDSQTVFSETIESVMCTGHNDFSPVKTSRATYEDRTNCHCCFAGYAHTVELCNDRNNNK